MIIKLLFHINSAKSMSENPFSGLCQTLEKFSQGVQTHLSQFASNFEFFKINDNISKNISNSNKPLSQNALFSISASSSPKPNNEITIKENKATPVSKEELGRATWTLLHTLGAQYPDKPTRQQRRDVKELMEILSRIYPCKDCADHFKEILKSNPVQAGSQAELSQWLCHVHNVVNRSLGKVSFQCERVDARWGKLDCVNRACDLQGTTSFGDDLP